MTQTKLTTIQKKTKSPGAHQHQTIPGTNQAECYNETAKIPCPPRGLPFSGQDAQGSQIKQAYQDNQDGTVLDLKTGLMWQKAQGPQLTFAEAFDYASTSTFAGHRDWRLPTIKELYSLISFDGEFGPTAEQSKPFINTAFFDFHYGKGNELYNRDKRWIDVQNWSSTRYVARTMMNDKTIFGVNFADGRIKGYPEFEPGSKEQKARRMYVRLVRGEPYGVPDWERFSTDIILDKSTGLMWQAKDDGATRNWKGALQYCSQLRLGGYEDWRLPNAKELQYIVDYTKSPTTSGSAAIYPEFLVSNKESYFWSSTTLLDGPKEVAPRSAVYIAFGRALGYVEVPPGSGKKVLLDVHGAGAQRADPKTGNPNDFPAGFGPQGDDVRIFNFVRCVRSTT